MHLKEGTLLNGGKYKITRFINSGGFGCTYQAVHTMFDTQVAVKEFFVKDFCNRDDASHVSVGTVSKKDLVRKLMKKFVEEARSVFMMSHPGIVKVTDVFTDNGTAYYVMNYISGRSLSDMVRADGPLSEERALGYIRQTADALRYVHSLNRIHLDVKPANIMVGEGDHAILIDFGASKHYDDSTGENTSTLLGVNTPGYAPLEQMRQSFTTFLPAADIYALGATLYKLLTGDTPPDAIDLVAGTASLRPLPANVSANTRRAVAKAMQYRVEKRPQTIDEFLGILDGTIACDPSVEEIFVEEKPVPHDDTLLDDKTHAYDTAVEQQPAGKHPAPETPEAAMQPEDSLEIKPEPRGIKKMYVAIAAMVGILISVAVIMLVDNDKSEVSPTDGEEEVLGGEVVAPDKGPAVEKVEDLKFKNTFNRQFTYTGEAKDGVPNGKGIGRYADGSVYEGEYRDGMRYGQGKLTESSGTFEGTFMVDKQVEGTYTLADGMTYKGTFNSNEDPDNGNWYNKDGTLYAKVVNGVNTTL